MGKFFIFFLEKEKEKPLSYPNRLIVCERACVLFIYGTNDNLKKNPFYNLINRMISKEESLIMGARFRKSKSHTNIHRYIIKSYSFPVIVIGRKSLQKFANFIKRICGE